MSHHLYQTQGIIIDSYGVGESNRSYRVLTKDMGLVYISAQNARGPVSKLRPGLLVWSLSDIALIQAKRGWKVINSVERKAFFPQLREFPEAKKTLTQVLMVVTRLIKGEDANAQLFKEVIEFCEVLVLWRDDKELVKNLEYVMMLRILFILGYIAADADIQEFLTSDWMRTSVEKGQTIPRIKIAAHINKALKESHL